MNEDTTILIDNALATGRVSALDPEDRALQELALALRDDAPVPERDFQLRMDAKVAAGFPRRRDASAPARDRIKAVLTRRPQLAALGGVAAALVALVVAVSLTGKGGRDGTVSSGASGGGSAPAAEAMKGAPAATDESAKVQSQPGVAADSIAPSTPSTSISPLPPPDNFVGGRNRKVQRSAALTLAAPESKLNQVGDQVIAVTDRYRGFVMRSSVTSAADGQAGGSFDLRIPVRTLSPALRDLSALADVKSRTENADDVTASFVSARTRLEELNAERRGLLRRLEKATTDQQSAAIRARIRIVNAQIESAQAGLKALQRSTSYAAVSVSLVPKDKSTGGGGISDGARDLRDSLVDSANIALRVLGVAIPIGLVLALLIAANAWSTRRRREAALDS
jgi:hypothetical protein